MVRGIAYFLVGVAAITMMAGDVVARGGGGGGRGGGGGGGGSRPSASHSPSMSRPATSSKPRPSSAKPAAKSTAKSTSKPAAKTAAKPAPKAGAKTAANPTAKPGTAQAGAGRTAAAAGARPAGANTAVADFLDGGSAPGRGAVKAAPSRTDIAAKGPSRAANLQPARVANAAGTRGKLADGQADRRTPRQQDLGKNADQVRDGLRGHYDDKNLFNNFWGDVPNAHYRFNQNPVFWSWATFATARAFMPWNWGTEQYYDYGEGGNVYYEGDTVHVGETEVPAEEYADQAEAIATSAPEVANPDEMEWLPLGVFALTKDGEADAIPNMFLQLAVSKEGIVAGTFQNKTTGQTEAIEGMVDQKSQRAAWTIAGKSSPIVEAGMANLTMNETRVLVHFADGQTQEWLMLHLENPEAETPKE